MGRLSDVSAKASPGFTLIELLVVIAIIGLLASIILASLGTARTRSRDAKRIADVRSLQDALELYATKHAVYPATLADLVTDGDTAAIPTDPNTQTNYAYIAYSFSAYGAGPGGSCSNGYHLGAQLEGATTVSHIAWNPTSPYDGLHRCAGSAYTAGSDCAATGVCLAASSGDFSGAGNVYDVRQ